MGRSYLRAFLIRFLDKKKRLLMKRTISRLLVLIFMVCFLATSCQRSGGEVWEDSKTSMRHIGNGFKSFFGKHGDSRQVPSGKHFVGPVEDEYIPLNDEDLYRKLSIGDTTVLDKINQDTSIPQSKEAPGEKGSDIPGVEGFVEPNSLELSQVFRNVHFDTNDYIIRGHENLAVIDGITDYMTKRPNLYVFIEGHCDERGPAAYNLSLGSKRSNSVRNLLIKGGVDLNRVFTISYGKERPVAFGHNAADWRKNRRSQFKLYYTE